MPGKLTTERLVELLQQEGKEPPHLIDVRANRFYQEGHIPDSLSIELDALRYKAYAVLGRSERIVCVGAESKDGKQAAYSLETTGFDHTYYLEGGFPAWQAAQHPVESGAGPDVNSRVGFKMAPAFGDDPRGEWKTAPP